MQTSQVDVSAWAGVAQIRPVLVVYTSFGNVEGLAVGLKALPETGSGGSRFGGGLQDSNALVITENFHRGALPDEVEVVVEVFAELNEGALGGIGLFSLWFLGSLESGFHTGSTTFVRR
jgi:hypothetical protein